MTNSLSERGGKKDYPRRDRGFYFDISNLEKLESRETELIISD